MKATGGFSVYSYGLELDDDDSYRGTMKCKPTGTFIGNANFTFMIEAPYGR